MTYKECLDYLFSQLPIYQREGKAAYKADLNNTIDLLARLDNPENDFRSIHIAGTNGKGSVSHMLASVLQEAGYKTGLYTSPHLKDFRERIKINGKDIPESTVVEFVESNRELVADIHPSFFEWTVALAFKYFSDQKVEVAVVETGLGGRLDSTNVLKPDVSVITNIGLDHTQFLGDTLDKIAFEKAGIIKENTPVIIGEFLPETRPIFLHQANEKQAPIVFAQDGSLPVHQSDLKGPYQYVNQQCVLHTLEVLKSIEYDINDDDIKKGMTRVVKNTSLRGRWEYLSEDPRILVDMAHNKEGVEILVNTLSNLTYKNLHIVWGMVNDKDIASVLKLLPLDATYYFCKPDIPRGLDSSVLSKAAFDIGLNGEDCGSVQNALQHAKSAANSDDLIFVGGSTFVVAEVV